MIGLKYAKTADLRSVAKSEGLDEVMDVTIVPRMALIEALKDHGIVSIEIDDGCAFGISLEDIIHQRQFTIIKRKCGEDAANNANYGWFVDGSGDMAIVNTKVYGHGLLVSTATCVADIKHSWVR